MWETNPNAELVGRLLGGEVQLNFVTTNELVTLQREIINHFGGGHGIRDQALLDSAANRPAQAASYDPEMSAAKAGAMLCYAIVRNHPFVDGNKRTAYFSMLYMLERNGMGFDPDPKEALLAMRGMAAGEIDEDAFTQWVSANAWEKPAPDTRREGERP